MKPETAAKLCKLLDASDTLLDDALRLLATARSLSMPLVEEKAEMVCGLLDQINADAATVLNIHEIAKERQQQ